MAAMAAARAAQHVRAAQAYNDSQNDVGYVNEQREKEAKKDAMMDAILEEDDEKLEELCKPEEEPLPIYNDVEKFPNPLAVAIIKMTMPFYQIAYGRFAEMFDYFIITVIVMAGAMVGIQTYPKYSCVAKFMQDEDGKWKESITSHYDRTVEFCLKNGDNVFGGDGIVDQSVKWIFVAEMGIKILANGVAPYRYWCGHQDWRWNNFDFFIVAMSFEAIANLILSGGGGGSVMVLRLFRLARLLKLVGKIPKLQSIVIGLIAGVKAVGYIALLLFLVFYIFAIAGMIFFLPNDPFHFRSIPISMLSLFRAATLEDWTDIMYINIYGCNKYQSGVYYVKSAYRDPITNTDIPGTFDGNPYFSTWEEVPNYFRCNDLTEIEGKGGVMQSQIQPQPEVSVIYWVLFTFVSAFVMLSLFVGAVTLAMSDSMDPDKEEDITDFAAKLKRKRNYLRDNKDEFRTRLVHGWNVYASKTGDRKTIADDAASAATRPPKYRWGVYSRFAEMCKSTAENGAFSGFVVFTIIVAGISVGVDQEIRDAPAMDAPKSVNVYLWYPDVVINWIFTVEVMMKIFGEDYHPWTYLDSGWNQFDFIIVFCSWLPLMLPGGGGGLGALKLLRLLRLFRIMRVIKFLPALAVIVDSLIVGFESIGFIAIILFVVFYLFAILGMMIFSKNDPFHFGTLHRALLTLFRVSTFEDWTDVMYTNIYSCSQWGYNDDDSMPKSARCSKSLENGKLFTGGAPSIWAAVYFIIFVFLGALVLLTLFVGVVTTSMETASANQEKFEKSIVKVRQMSKDYKIPKVCTSAVEQSFSEVDLDGSGQVSVQELKVAMKFTELIDHQEGVEALMREIDLDGNDEVDLYEFSVYLMNHLAHMAGSSKRFVKKQPEEEES
jgi:voltage-gated sodium channel